MSMDLYAQQAILTTHALDLSRGCPGAGLGVTLREGDARTRATPLASVTLNAQGRCAAPLLSSASARAGSYVLDFDLAAYFDAPSIFPCVRVCFRLAEPLAHYHVPLIVAPGGYSCYRGAPPSRSPRESGAWHVGDPASWPDVMQPSQGTGGGAGLSLHVIDIARGVGACGLQGTLLRDADCSAESGFAINAEGRTDHWLIPDGCLVATDYVLEFQVGDYYRQLGFGVGDHPFFDTVPVKLRIQDIAEHHHVVLLLSPWGYSCYRGS
ncbi:hydroxyisourate hydrolase [Castellaniella sp.]|uniref:hydroxyisourate hydrolase n=1 Tax=Castellaniella sp. TaxID=1955812 RepID=UPI002AFE3096|nr:hydroxyisourate hydrolase [Castellaniella sp.]